MNQLAERRSTSYFSINIAQIEKIQVEYLPNLMTPPGNNANIDMKLI